MMDGSGVSLDEATRLDANGDGYVANLSRAWEIWGPNGGYLAALALRAAGMHAEIKQPASFYCHFLRTPDFDRVELEVSVSKRSRRSEAFSVQMTQRGKPFLQALVRTAADAPGYEHQQVTMPEVPGPEEVEPEDGKRRPPFPFWDNVERRTLERPSPTEELALVRQWARRV